VHNVKVMISHCRCQGFLIRHVLYGVAVPSGERRIPDGTIEGRDCVDTGGAGMYIADGPELCLF
jgi:hypothetical protein